MANDESNQGDKKKGRRDPHDLTFFQEIIKSYVQNWMNALGKLGMDSSVAQAIREVLVEYFGSDLEKFLVTNGLTLGAAAISIRRALVARGVPEWIAESLDEGLNDLLEGARTAALDGKLNRHSAQRVLQSTEAKMNKKFIEEVTFEKSLLILTKDDVVKIDNFFFALPIAHQKRFNALKSKLKTPGDIRLFLQRVEMLMQAHPHIAPSRTLELIEPAYGVTPSEAAVTSIGQTIAGIPKKIIGRLSALVKRIVDHPKETCDEIAQGLYQNAQTHKTNNETLRAEIERLGKLR